MATKPYHDGGTLRRLYVDEGLSGHEIADRFEVTPPCIYNWMERHGIEREDDPQKIPREELKRALFELEDEVGHVPTYWDNYREGEYSGPAYQNEFGSWNGALEACDMELHSAPLVEVECHNCGDTKERSRHYLKNDRHFCNRECRKEFHTTEITCEYCGGAKRVRRSYAENGYRDYCSNECWKADIPEKYGGQDSPVWQERPDVTCDNCGDPLYRPPSQFNEHNFCNQDCHMEWRIEEGTHRGENSPLFKGGKPDYYGPNFYSQRKKALERDGHQCRQCGMDREEHIEEHGWDIEMHHRVKIITFKDDDGVLDHENANKLSNLITLCNDCHDKWEDIPVQPPADLISD